jgi:hypothetical protein
MSKTIDRAVQGGAGVGERYRVTVLVVALLLAAVAGGSASRLGVAGPEALLGVDDPGEQRDAELAAAFESPAEAVVLIDAGESGQHEVLARRAAAALTTALSREPAVKSVIGGFDRNVMPPKLLLTQPLALVEEVAAGLAESAVLLESPTPGTLLQAGLARSMVEAGRAAMAEPPGSEASTAASLDEAAGLFEALMSAWTLRLQTPAEEPLDLLASLRLAVEGSPWEPLRTVTGRLLVVRVLLDPARADEALGVLDRHVEAVRFRFAPVELGVTGVLPTQRAAERELRAAGMRAAGAGTLALLVLCGLAWRSWRLPAAVLVILSLSVIYAVGLAGASVGRLTPYSLVAVGVVGAWVLISAVGLAAAYARCGRVRDAVGAVGRGIVIGAMGLASIGAGLAVFAAAGWHAAPGTGEAGVVLAGGVVAASLAVLWVGPAVLSVMCGKSWRVDSRVAKREDLAGMVGAVATRRRGLAVGAVVGLGLVMGGFAVTTPRTLGFVGYLPSEPEGVRWLKRALADGGESGAAAYVTAKSLAEVDALASKLRQRPEVGRVSGIARLAVEHAEAKRAVLAELDEQIGDAANQAVAATEVDSTLTGPTLEQTMRAVEAALGLLATTAGPAEQAAAQRMVEAARAWRSAFESLDSAPRKRRLEALQQDYTRARIEAGRLVTQLLEPRPLRLADLDGARSVFGSWIAEPDGPGSPRLLMKVYPAGLPAPASEGLTLATLASFLEAVRSSGAEVGGALARTAARSQALQGSLVIAALIGLLVLGGMGWLWGGAKRAAACLAVVSMAGLAYVASLGWLGAAFDPIAWTVLPIPLAAVVGWHGLMPPTAEKDSDALEPLPGRFALTTEALGLTLAVFFVVAAGLRGAQADSLTAVAVATCVALAAAGLTGLLLLGPARR